MENGSCETALECSCDIKREQCIKLLFMWPAGITVSTGRFHQTLTLTAVKCFDTSDVRLHLHKLHTNETKAAVCVMHVSAFSIWRMMDFQQTWELLCPPSVLVRSHSRCDNVWQVLGKKRQQIKCGNQMDNWCYHRLIEHYRYYCFKPQ